MFSILLLVAVQGLLVHATPLPEPTPPGIPATSTAKTELAALTVQAAGSQDGYARDLFPTVSLSFLLNFMALVFCCDQNVHPLLGCDLFTL
jgi:hypothetical protein